MTYCPIGIVKANAPSEKAAGKELPHKELLLEEQGIFKAMADPMEEEEFVAKRRGLHVADDELEREKA